MVKRQRLLRSYYSDKLFDFLSKTSEEILGFLTKNSQFPVDVLQRNAWIEQTRILKTCLSKYSDRGHIFYEYSIPRLGKRIDAILILDHVLFLLEFKIGESIFHATDIDQVWDYALDLRNFHEESHDKLISPILIASENSDNSIQDHIHNIHHSILEPYRSNASQIAQVIDAVLLTTSGAIINSKKWSESRYAPTPTIIEAAQALYSGHDVADVSRKDASAINLSLTSEAVTQILQDSKANRRKSICFVTGVPGAGKTLVGLDIATQHIDKENELYSVYLSGNGPLVAVLREALALDSVARAKLQGNKKSKGDARREVSAFIQNVHHFRDECLVDSARPPVEHIVLFDEAQRAWNLQKTIKFMRQKKGFATFEQSEPEFLISCLDRHQDWAVIVCLVGGGQEINDGEAGIKEWIDSLCRSYPDWNIYLSNRLRDSEYAVEGALTQLTERKGFVFQDDLHLSVSMRSFRAETVSSVVKSLLDLDEMEARSQYREIKDRYPIVITRNLPRAKGWLKTQSRGNERYGIVVSSEAQRLKPYAIDVKTPVNPVHWFLDGKDDVRSSYFLEDVATEFQVQGLELDWACIVWDGDLRFNNSGWRHFSFVGNRWNRIRKQTNQGYLKNAYRVLLTRARQGMVIVVPEADENDQTRVSECYDPTYEYLKRIGFQEI